MSIASVVIPVLNGSNYIRYAIESVLNQTYQDIELLVVDAGSTDNTREICSEYGIQVLDGKPAMRDNWQAALDAATGKYVKLLCHDDTIEPTCVEKQVKVMEEDDSIFIVVGQKATIDHNGDTMWTQQLSEKYMKIMGRDGTQLLLYAGNVFGELPVIMFRNSNLHLPPHMNWLSDMYLYIDAMSKGHCYYIPEILANIRKHPGQDTYRCIADPEHEAKEAFDKAILLDKAQWIF